MYVSRGVNKRDGWVVGREEVDEGCVGGGGGKRMREWGRESWKEVGAR